jgi:hypothetical protein
VVTVVRDRATRQVRAILRDPASRLPDDLPLGQVELLVSNGVGSATYAIDPVTRRVRQ